MKSEYSRIFLAPIIAGALAGCAVAPLSPESWSGLVAQSPLRGDGAAAIQHASSEPYSKLPLYQRPPNRLFGILQEQGSLDAEPDVALMVEYQQLRKELRAAAIDQKAAPNWIDLGPNNNLGRIIDIAFHPQNSNIIYIASPGGGVYKTTDGGASWKWLGGLPYQAISSIAIDPLNPNVVYFGTGHYNGSGSDLLSQGVYKTTDAGATFSLLAPTVPTTSNTDWLRVTRVVTHPTTPNVVFAGTTAGFFLSSDGGANWSQPSRAATYDIAIDPNNPVKMLRGKYDGSASYSIDAGATWSQTQIVPGSTTANIRTRVKYAKSAPNVVYAAVDQNSGELHKSIDGGLNWSFVSTPAHNGTQGFHTNQLWVSPIDANHIIVGGVDLYKSLDGGQIFTKISDWASNSQQTGNGSTPDTPHADHNAVASPPNYSAANAVFYVGTDGGLFSTSNARTVAIHTGWTKSGASLVITQFVGAAGRRLNGIDTLIAGTQDNGTLFNFGYQGWSRIAGGDGGATTFDPGTDVAYGQYPSGEVFRYGLGMGLRTICAGITEATPDGCGSANTTKVNFYAPLELDPNNSNRLYFGANSLWVSANAKGTTPTWSAVKAPVAGTTSGTTSSNYINAISIYQGDSNVVLVGHNDGQVFRTNNGLVATPLWTALGGGLPTGRMVGAVLIDPADANRLYVGFTGYFADNLWRSDNGGSTWRNISAGLPPGSIYTITRHPLAKEKLYVGTIWGSYGSDNGGNSWPVVNDGPYGTQIRKLFWLGNDTLVAATFGSGMVRAIVAVSVPNTVVEYYHPVLDNYFITADPNEQAAVDRGAAGAEWRRTSITFKAGGPTLVCRFYGSQSPGPNSHFYTADAAECAELKRLQAITPASQKRWNFESNDFNTTSAANGGCPAGLVPVLRAYNNGFSRGIDSNHRITTNPAAITEVVGRGWVSEGVVMCAPS